MVVVKIDARFPSEDVIAKPSPIKQRAFLSAWSIRDGLIAPLIILKSILILVTMLLFLGWQRGSWQDIYTCSGLISLVPVIVTSGICQGFPFPSAASLLSSFHISLLCCDAAGMSSVRVVGCVKQNRVG